MLKINLKAYVTVILFLGQTAFSFQPILYN